MRKVWDIHGGVHPAENKHQSNQQPIAAAGIPDELIFPLSQHIGAPASPIVAVGDKVLKGQMIAKAKGFVSVPVHASSSGEVIAIEPRPIAHPSGMDAPCIVIKTDGKDQWVERQGLGDYSSIEKSELLTCIRNAGIAGMGGAGFPSAVKLASRDDKPIETLVINGTECEPYITADDVLMRERADQIIAGAEILRYLINPSKEVLIGVEDNKPEGIAALEQAAQGSDIQIVAFPTKYPSGGEKQLIQILTGKEVPSGGLPADIGVVCQNLGTTVAIYKAVTFGEPLIDRITTVTGYACKEQRNFEVLLGTPARFLLEQCGFQAQDCSRLIMGGPMMGFTIDNIDAPIVKSSNCLLAPTAKELPPPPPAQACIRCGLCAEACPASLLPQQLYWFSRAKEYEKLEDHNLMDCIECGACSFACPSNIPLVQYYRASKAEIRQINIDQEKADSSKIRFEARQERLAREEAEKDAKRKARQEAAKAKAAAAAAGNSPDAVQEAIDRSKAKKVSADPAQAAIERAMAKRSGGDESAAASLESLEKAVAAAQKRLTSSTEKLQQAKADGADTVPAFETAVAKTQQKLADAQAKLAQYHSDNPAVAAAPAPSADPAQAAIERAMAKRAGSGEPETVSLESLEKALAAIEKRLAASQQKLTQAEAEASDKVEAFKTAVQKTQQKRDDAQQKLDAFKAKQIADSNSSDPNSKTDSGAEAATGDAAQDAIARAMAKRDAQSTMSPTEKLQQKVDSLQKRLTNSREKLAAAVASGDDNASILEDSIEKMEAKLADAKQQLADAQ